ncbi:MAG TPA: hypothetical protein VFR85_10485 [Anaeromyxobacteraceae bacterium]|nr:hypothetical protein [Anaeromyxobacteraceae bacterium]
MPRIGEILVELEACTEAEVRQGLENQVIFGGRLGTNLLELGSITEEELARGLGRRYGRPCLFGDLRIDPRLRDLLDPQLVDRLEAVPYLAQDRKLAVLVCNPDDLAVLDELAFATGRRIHPIVVPESRLWALMRRFFRIERQLRGLDLPDPESRRARPAPEPAAGRQPLGQDLMDEAEFESLYGRLDAGAPARARAPQAAAPPAAAPAPAAVPGAGPPATGPPAAAPPAGHAPPGAARSAPAAPAPPAPPPAAAPPPAGAALDLTDLVQPARAREAVLEALSQESAGHAPRPSFTPPEPLPPEPIPDPSPLGFQEAVRFLEGVADREAIAQTVLRYARTRFSRAVLLTVRGGAAAGWKGLGEGLDLQAVRRVQLGLSGPGVLETVVRSQAHFLGPLQKTEQNLRFLEGLGGAVPRNAFVLPILALGRVVNVLYLDNGRGGVVDASDVGELLILASKIAQSYDTLVRRAV